MLKYVFADHGINSKVFQQVKSIISKELLELIEPYVWPHFCFGHDIHVSRIIIFDMLNNEIINNNDTLIVTKDRQFLYNKTFNNILTFEEFCIKIYNNEITLMKENFIFLPKTIDDLLHFRFNNDLLFFNYDIYNTKYWNENLIKYIKNIEKVEIDNSLNNLITNNKFIIFIIRSFDHNNIDNNYINYINELRNKTIYDYKLIIFCYKDFEINKNLYDYLIKDILILVNLLLNENCYYFIGEISGLLEISYYHHGNNLKIFEFHNNHYEKSDDYLINNNFQENIMSKWNAKYISPINHKIFNNFTSILDYFNK